jgi:phytoene/squalene synthetase
VVVELSAVAEEHYERSAAEIDAFAADCRIAIESCIGVYRQLNLRVGAAAETVLSRESVPILDKLRALPPSKYWRLPLAYMGLQEPLEKLVA